MTQRRRNLYISAVALGLLALLADRLFLSSPQPVTAGPVTVQPRSAPTGGPAAAGAKQRVEVAAAPFPKPVAAVGDATATRDVFALTPAIQQALSPAPSDEDGEGAGGTGSTGGEGAKQKFEDQHRLGAVMMTPGAAFAVVDGRTLRVGDTLDGCVLAEVTGRTARFDCSGRSIELSVLNPGERTAP